MVASFGFADGQRLRGNWVQGVWCDDIPVIACPLDLIKFSPADILSPCVSSWPSTCMRQKVPHALKFPPHIAAIHRTHDHMLCCKPSWLKLTMMLKKKVGTVQESKMGKADCQWIPRMPLMLPASMYLLVGPPITLRIWTLHEQFLMVTTRGARVCYFAFQGVSFRRDHLQLLLLKNTKVRHVSAHNASRLRVMVEG